jgi:hypothetical protein
MVEENGADPRRMLLEVLLQKVQDDPYPSVAMLDLVEQLLQPDEVPVYIAVLLRRFQEENHPSIPILRRLTNLV